MSTWGSGVVLIDTHHRLTALKLEVNLVQQPSLILFQNLGLYKFQFRNNQAGEYQWYNKLILNSNTVTMKQLNIHHYCVLKKKKITKKRGKEKKRQSFDSLRWSFCAIYFKAERIALWTNVTTYPAEQPTLRISFTSPAMKRIRCWTNCARYSFLKLKNDA